MDEQTVRQTFKYKLKPTPKQEIGAHARSAIGVAELPTGIPVEVEAEVEIAM